VHQPDDPGVPGGDHFERQAREKNKRDVRTYWGVVLAVALAVMMLVFAWQTAGAQDPPVPLEEPCPSGDCTVYNQAFLFALTGDERTIRWSLAQNDVDTMDLFTELQVFEFPPKGGAFPVMRAELVEALREFGWTPTRAGTYFIEARACRTDGDLTTEPDAEGHPIHGLVLCSIIASSTDPTYTDPDVYPRGFVMLIKIAPATGGGIE
jgi:hypothetical protein